MTSLHPDQFGREFVDPVSTAEFGLPDEFADAPQSRDGRKGYGAKWLPSLSPEAWAEVGAREEWVPYNAVTSAQGHVERSLTGSMLDDGVRASFDNPVLAVRRRSSGNVAVMDGNHRMAAEMAATGQRRLFVPALVLDEPDHQQARAMMERRRRG